MQTFCARLSRSLDETRFLQEWEFNRALNAGPHTDFHFGNGGTIVMVTVHTEGQKVWPEDNFRQTFNIVAHKVDPSLPNPVRLNGLCLDEGSGQRVDRCESGNRIP